jgi:hypothetical protein
MIGLAVPYEVQVKVIGLKLGQSHIQQGLYILCLVVCVP